VLKIPLDYGSAEGQELPGLNDPAMQAAKTIACRIAALSSHSGLDEPF